MDFLCRPVSYTICQNVARLLRLLFLHVGCSVFLCTRPTSVSLRCIDYSFAAVAVDLQSFKIKLAIWVRQSNSSALHIVLLHVSKATSIVMTMPLYLAQRLFVPSLCTQIQAARCTESEAGVQCFQAQVPCFLMG